jgi:hypothetical protein
MRHYMVDPDNEERLLKIPVRVVAEIKAEALADAVQRVEALPHSLECVTRDANYSRPCNCLRGDALDAIKGDQQ